MKVLAFFHRFKGNTTVLSHFKFYYLFIIIKSFVLMMCYVLEPALGQAEGNLPSGGVS
jgi:hypothetical protein